MVEKVALIKTNYRVPESTREGSAGKSARRMLEVLEYFGVARRALTIREIAEHFDYPNSSASVLVKTAARMGYLSYDLDSRTYTSTLRLAALGAWVYETMPSGTGVLALAQDVAEKTNETVVVAVENDIYAQYVHVVPSKQAIQYYIPTGNRLLLCQSGTGWALLSMHDDASIERIVHRTRLRLGKAAAAITVEVMLAKARDVRRRGYAYSQGTVVAGGALIAMPLPVDRFEARLALGVASVQERLESNADSVIKLMRAAIRKVA
jgi:DNA-binding IclR family transcriptional regulator